MFICSGESSSTVMDISGEGPQFSSHTTHCFTLAIGIRYDMFVFLHHAAQRCVCA